MNRNKLKGLIVDRGLNQSKVAEAMNITLACFNRKLNKGYFTIEEANEIIAILQLTVNEAVAVFFAKSVA